jgi:hypothetical protein
MLGAMVLNMTVPDVRVLEVVLVQSQKVWSRWTRTIMRVGYVPCQRIMRCTSPEQGQKSKTHNDDVVEPNQRGLQRRDVPGDVEVEHGEYLASA